MNKIKYLLLALPFFIHSCDFVGSQQYNLEYETKLNPYGYAPLTAGIIVNGIEVELLAEVTVKGKGENGLDLTRATKVVPQKGIFLVPVIGLYPNYNNNVSVILKNEEGKKVGEYSTEIQTEKIQFEFAKEPVTKGEIGDNNLIFATLYTFVFEKGKDMDFLPKSVALDGQGEVRWYSDFKGRSHIVAEVIDGFLYCGSNKGNFAGKMVKYNFLGEELEVYDFSKDGKYYNLHHDIRKTENGSFLLTVNKKGEPTVENYVLEYNPNLMGNNVQLEMDVEEIMPNCDDFFLDLPFSYYANKKDIMHINGIYPYGDGEEILVSSRNAGLAKINVLSAELKWFLFPHAVAAKPVGPMAKEKSQINPSLKRSYSKYLTNSIENRRPPASGIIPVQDYTDFVFDYTEFLLTPLDKNGTPIKEEDVVVYGNRHEDFSYSYRQHSPIILKNGNIAVFDNGDKNFNEDAYSRAVEYKITGDASDGFGGTVQQVWEYILPSRKFAISVGNIKELESGNRLVNFGALDHVIGAKVPVYVNVAIVEVTPEAPAKEAFRVDFTLPPKSVSFKADKVNLDLIK